MKLRQITFGLVSSLAFSGAVFGHGMGHFHGNDADELDQPTPATSHEHTHEAGGKKHVHLEEREPRQWGVSFNTGWESRHVHYGVDETGVGGAYTNEINVNFYNFTFGVWNGIGTGNEFLEWDFTAAYTVDLDWVFVTPGYNFRYSPGIVEAGHGGHDDHGEEHDHDHDHDHEHEEEGHGHDHKEYGHELFIVLGTTKIPYVTPTVGFLWDLNNNPGGLLEFRLNGDIPVWKKVLSLQPYALMGLNFGYNTKDYYGWNNFQFGVQATWSVMKYIDVYAGINYSVAMEALRTIDQGNVVWANVGLSFNY